jgi:predicted small lipoprotein YifL
MNAKHFLLLLVILLSLTACGRKGPVQPLLRPLPDAPEQVLLEQKGERFLLSWGIPRQNQDGSPLTDLQGFHLYRMRYDPTQECPECRDTSTLLRQVDIEYLREVRRIDQRLYFWDADLAPGVGYLYRVVPYTRAGREGASAQARRVFFDPPAWPTGLEATGHDRLVRLAWDAVEEEREGAELLGYHVYRRLPREDLPPMPISRTIQEKPSYEDFSVENDRTYVYTVRTVIRIGEFTLESASGEPVEVTPREGR